MNPAAIVIVTYNSEAVIEPCLKAACEVHDPAQILVVDNGSSDGTVSVVRRYPVRLVENDRNSGFAGAANQGIGLTTNDLILLLNPDAVLKTSVQSLSDTCHIPGVGACGGLLVNQDGSPQTGFTLRRLPTAAALSLEALLINRLWPSNPVNRHYRCLDLNLKKPAEIEQPAGALLMVRRKAWAEAGGFDESFCPVWFEDVDFCKRIRERGWRILYNPAVVATHGGGHSVGNLSLRQKQLYWYGSLLRYARKHYNPLPGRALCFAILVGVAVRVPVGILIERSFHPLAGCFGVLRLAGTQLVAPTWTSPGQQ